jgi:hypothetical protein
LSPSQNIYYLPLQIPPSKYLQPDLRVSEFAMIYGSVLFWTQPLQGCPSVVTLVRVVIENPSRITRIF